MSLSFTGGRQSGAVLYSAFGVMGGVDSGVRDGVSKSNGSSGSQTGSGYSTDVSDDNLPNDAQSAPSEPNNSDSDEQVLIDFSFIHEFLFQVYISILTLFFLLLCVCRMRGWSLMTSKRTCLCCLRLLTPAV